MVTMGKTVLVAVVPVVLALAGSASAMDSADMVLQHGTDGKKLVFNGTPEKGRVANVTPVDNVGSSLRIAGLWLVLLGVGSAAFVYIRRRQNLGATANGTAARMSLMERLSLGARGELLLVRACDRFLVVAAQGNQLALLTDFSATEESSDVVFADALARRTTPAAPKNGREARDLRDKREIREAVREQLYRPEPRSISSANSAPTPATTPGSSPGIQPWPEPGEVG